jgi:ankyrin repeat protein
MHLLLIALLALPADQPPGTQFAVAIENHDADAVKALLASGASTETLIDYGEHKITPLIKAAWEGDADIVKVLLAAGAKVNAQASDTGETALLNAVSNKFTPVVKILLDAGADVSVKNRFNFNALNTAVAANDQDLAALLLDHGANLEAESSTLTPLMFAASAGNVDMIRFLVKRGAKVNHASKESGQTALISAIIGGKADAVQALVDLKADVNARLKGGDSPLKLAMKGDQDDVVKILKAAGAKP